MDSKEIQTRLDALAKSMMAKGLREPSAKFWFESDAEACVFLRWKDVTKAGHSYSGAEYKSIRVSPPEAAFKEAEAFIQSLPSAEEARMSQFMGALANVIELGKDNGVEVEFLNPLTATMKKLSENILTDMRAA